MEEKFFIDPFDIKVFLREVHIGRNGNYLVFSPPSLKVAEELILSAMRIESFSVLPKRLYTEPFFIIFDANKEMDLQKDSENSASIHFTFEEGDTLMQVLQSAYNKWTDVTRAETGRELAPADRTSPFTPPA